MFWAFHPLLVEVYDKWLTCKFGGTTAMAVGRNHDAAGREVMEVFRVGLDHQLWHTVQRRKCARRDDMDMEMTPHDVTFDHWTHWERAGGARDIARIKVVTDNHGRPAVLAMGTDRRLALLAHDGNGPRPWRDLGAEVVDFAGCLNESGALEVLAFTRLGASMYVASATETSAGSGLFSAWDGLMVAQPGTVEAVRDGHGQPHAFVRTADGKVHHLWKMGAADWRNQLFWDGPVRMCAAGVNADGRLEVFALRAQDDGIYHRWVKLGLGTPHWTEPSTWSGWERMGTGQFNHFAVGRNEDKRLEVFAIDVSGRVQHRWQMAVNAGWSEWVEIPALDVMGHHVRKVVGALPDHAGRLKVFVHAEDDFIYMAEQGGAGQGPWIGWTTI
jgi:hypothetical protein